LVRIDPLKGGLFVYGRRGPEGQAGPLEMAVLLSSSGTAFPVLSEARETDGPGTAKAIEALARTRIGRAYKPAACVGASSQVAALERSMRWSPEIDIEYDAMCLPFRARAARLTVSGIAEYRRARPDDLDSLLPIAGAYEKAEVMTALHAFDPDACRAAQAKSLRTHTVYLAAVRGRVVARAQTNARGWSYEQIGGVYVEPEYRGLGIGRGVVEALVADIASRGRGSSLFVKKANAVARSMYVSMGFMQVRDYRVSYFR
jgi:ribosomal protein S18 acetylase RimI-like enzyme